MFEKRFDFWHYRFAVWATADRGAATSRGARQIGEQVSLNV